MYLAAYAEAKIGKSPRKLIGMLRHHTASTRSDLARVHIRLDHERLLSGDILHLGHQAIYAAG